MNVTLADAISTIFSNKTLHNDFMAYNDAIDKAIEEKGMTEEEAIEYVISTWEVPEF